MMSTADLAHRLTVTFHRTPTRTIVLACFALAAVAAMLGAIIDGETDWAVAWALVAVPNLVVLWRAS